MEYLQTKTTVTQTDRGEFTALAATFHLDRQGERLVPGAFTESIRAWRESGLSIPVHWSHQGDAANVIGSIDPQRMHEVAQGLHVEGRLDLEDSAIAREAWRSMKGNRIALSFGFLALADRKGTDGARELTKVDIFEISLTPHPANPNTRILSMKGVPHALVVEAEQDKAAQEHAEQVRRLNMAGFGDETPIQISSFEC